jgi:lipopolysaccharide export system protein LptA
MRLKAGLWAFAAALTMVASTAAPQPNSAQQRAYLGAQEKSQDQPVQIDAQTLEVRDKKKIATFSGNVHVVQGDTTMKCKTLVVFYGQEIGLSGDKPTANANATPVATPNAQNIRRIEAHGDVTVLSKDQNATGDLGVYDPIAKTITLTGNVVVSQGRNIIHGERVVVDTVTGNAHIEAAPGATQSRVRALIVPSKDQKGGQSNIMTIGPGPAR